MEYYQVYQAHSPSGGVSAVDSTKYKTLEEARGAAEALMMSVDVFYTFGNAPDAPTFPTFWAQKVRESQRDGFTFIEFLNG